MPFFKGKTKFGDSKNSAFFFCCEECGWRLAKHWDFPFPYAPKRWLFFHRWWWIAWKGSWKMPMVFFPCMNHHESIEFCRILTIWMWVSGRIVRACAGWWPRHRPASGNLSDSVFNSFRLVTWLNDVKSSSSNFSLVSKSIYIHYLHPFTSVYTTGRAKHFLVETDAWGVFYSLAKHEAAQRATKKSGVSRRGALHQRRLGWTTAW